VTVLNEIAFGGRTSIIELGSGMSTVVISRLLAERGGSLVSVEHEPQWAGIVRAQLELENLGTVAQIEGATLEPHELSLDGAPWYSADAIATLPSAADLLLVDGPPGYGEGMSLSRYPALPALADRLTPGAVVILDDADREGEQQIVARWLLALPEWSFGVDTATGVAVGRR
jgi:predicted O-methyltransferase YrrM